MTWSEALITLEGGCYPRIQSVHSSGHLERLVYLLAFLIRSCQTKAHQSRYCLATQLSKHMAVHNERSTHEDDATTTTTTTVLVVALCEEGRNIHLSSPPLLLYLEFDTHCKPQTLCGTLSPPLECIDILLRLLI